MSKAKLRHWDPEQIRMFVRDAKAPLGSGWKFMSDPLKVALLDAKALSVVRLQTKDAVEITAIDELRFAMLKEAGLNEV